MDVLGALKQATKRLEGSGKIGAFGSVAEIVIVFDYLLYVFEDRLQSCEDVVHDEHEEAPEDYLAINLRAALLKAHKYYNMLNLPPAYYTATILHPRYKHYLDAAWAEKPNWLESSNRNLQALWVEYKSLPKPRVGPIGKPNNIDDVINSFIKPIAGQGVDPIEY